ncbi:MAG: glycosyltransferase family 4 protein [Bacteroidales bacterium]|nr:glycosyltransferase family 4 protein [Bacteroidales bacterium]
MKVLQLCNKPPYPPVDGGTLAMNCVTQGLMAEGYKVKVLTIETDKHPLQKTLIPENYIQQTGLESVYVDLNIHLIDALAALLCGESYHVKRYVSKDFEQKLIAILKQDEYDIIQLEGLYLTPYVSVIRQFSKARIVLRAHNVENQIWRRIAHCTKNPLKRWYLKHLALALNAYEQEHVNDYDAVACITQNDADAFRKMGCRKPISVIPFGITPEVIDNVTEEENSLFHIGSMDWMPNQEGIDWFLESVWPALHKEIPEARLYLAGRKMPERLMKAQIEGVNVVGEVADSAYFIGSKQINIVPLLSGSGIRVKIIEAMSLGKTVVTTSIGAEGINYTNGKDILIANTPEEFVAQIRRCVADKDFCRQVGQNAYELIVKEYGTQALTKKFLALYEQ